MRIVVSRLIPCDGTGPLVAFCDATIDGAVTISGLRIVRTPKGLFVSMPRRQGKDQRWYDNVVPLTKASRDTLRAAALEALQACTTSAPDQPPRRARSTARARRTERAARAPRAKETLS
jgi:DNA-binding cell septation regulator SpoVG